jgi:ribonucleoside-diphosphate reductase beta chain
MTYSVFRSGSSDATKENMFFGADVNVARYDQFRFPIFDKLTEKQHSFFWRPEEVDVSRDRVDFNNKMTDNERFIFVSNLQYQILLDSVQGRAPSAAFGTIASLPEMETWISTWDFSETIHSRSYTHILRNLFTDPSDTFNRITEIEEIKVRATDVSKYYDSLISDVNQYNRFGTDKVTVNGMTTRINMREMKKKLYLCMQSVNALEAIRFYVSFACTFAFAERALMEGNSKIMKLIARDEAVHLSSTQHIINLWRKGKDDPEMAEIAIECEDEARQIFLDAVNQEKEWAKYLFSKGSMLGMNEAILCQYVEYIANMRMRTIGFVPEFDVTSNPLPWMNSYLESDNVQVAPQETEISSYLVGQIDSEVGAEEFETFEL